MGKEKEAPRVDFDHSRYSHLVNASLDVFVSEFLSRNDEFRQDYSALAHAPKKSPELLLEFYAKWGIGGLKKLSPRKKTPARINVVLRSCIKSLAFVVPEYEEVGGRDHSLIRLAKKIASPGEEGLLKDLTVTTKSVHRRGSIYWNYETSLPTKYRKTVHFIQPPRRDASVMGPMTWLAGTSEDGLRYGTDRIIFSVSASTPISKLRIEIERHLKQHQRIQKRLRRRTDWIMYLKVYDVWSRDESIRPSEIVKILGLHGKDGANYSRLMKLYYERCKKLIEGGYRRFI